VREGPQLRALCTRATRQPYHTPPIFATLSKHQFCLVTSKGAGLTKELMIALMLGTLHSKVETYLVLVGGSVCPFKSLVRGAACASLSTA